LYDEHTGRKVLAKRGQKTVIDKEGERTTTDFATPEELLENIDLSTWNEYHIIAKGPNITLKINGITVCEVIDEEDGEADSRGIIALQIHKGPPMTIRYRDIKIKKM
ncbi:MAG: DUF1080 domain-containing protein, partial [Verrucomicrobiota bacterium]